MDTEHANNADGRSRAEIDRPRELVGHALGEIDHISTSREDSVQNISCAMQKTIDRAKATDILWP